MTQNILSFFVKQFLGLFKTTTHILIGVLVFVAIGLLIHFKPELIPETYRGYLLDFILLVVGSLWAKGGALLPQLSEYQNVFDNILEVINNTQRDLDLSGGNSKEDKVRELVQKAKNLK